MTEPTKSAKLTDLSHYKTSPDEAAGETDFRIPCRLELEDGAVYRGYSFGAPGAAAGETVFNTAMTGYPESLTDPSYRGQILVLTYPLAGNYGAPDHPGGRDEYGLSRFGESHEIHAAGLAVSDYSAAYSHWNARKSLSQWLREHGVPGIFGVDTRSLTRRLRECGAMRGRIIAGNAGTPSWDDWERNPAAAVSIREKTVYGSGRCKIIVVDCGVKHNILRRLLELDSTVIRVPLDYDYSGEECDGLFLSNGPGDPEQNGAAVEHLRRFMKRGLPIFGICLGNQLMALAAGGRTRKMKYGHRGHNQPVRLEGTNRVFITPQNHGYAVDETSLKEGWSTLFRNLNDGSNEGLIHNDKPFFSAQFHPEACGGPSDTRFLFNHFLDVAAGKVHHRDFPLASGRVPVR